MKNDPENRIEPAEAPCSGSRQPSQISRQFSRRELMQGFGAAGLISGLAACSSSPDAPSKSTVAAPELIFASTRRIAEAIRNREVSSLEMVDACLQRIEQVNPLLNAVVMLAAEPARQQARDADTQLARGESRGPLHGVPMTIKDSFDTQGLVSTAGTEGRTSFMPWQDATVVSRLRAAGAILMGKTNTPEMTLSGETDNLIYGRTNNPYDLSLTPSGSSGGAAAIVAAGGSPFDFGSDTGGSIRMPCHFCGIAGIKPTSGRVPRTGHIISFGGALDSLTQLGPMTRFVDDLSLLLPIVAGVDWRDPAIVPMPLEDPSRVEFKQLRAAFYSSNGLFAPTAETQQTLESARKALTDAGVTFVEDRPAILQESFELIMALMLADGGAWVHRLLGSAQTTRIHPGLEQWLQQDQMLSTGEFTALLERWNRYQGEMLAFLENYDFILCPVSAHPASPHGSVGEAAFGYTAPFNLTGWPAAVVRAGATSQDLPIGVQLVARPWREDIALAAARHLEEALGGWKRPPL